MAAERLEDFDMASSAEAPPCRWVAMAAERLEDFDRTKLLALYPDFEK